MNLKTMTLALMIACAGSLAACSSPTVIQHRDGSSDVAPDEPKYNKDSGMYEYDKNGKLEDWVYAKEQSAQSMLKILGYIK